MAYTADVNRWRGPAPQGEQYYRPGSLEVLKNDKGHGAIRLENFKTSLPHLHSIGGWCERAAELTGGKDIRIDMNINDLQFDIHYA